MYQEMTLLEFQERFNNEQKCWEYLRQKRWPEGFVCPRCEHTEAFFHGPRKLYECKACRYQASLTAGTILHRTRTPLRYWFWMMFLMSRNKAGYSMLGLQKMLGIRHYKTAWMMGHKIRKAMADRNERYQLSGLVEMDDAFFGGKRRKIRGRGAEHKQKVLVMAENRGEKPGFTAMQIVDRIDEKSVRRTACEWIQPGQKIRTDGYVSFLTLAKEAFHHQRVLVETPAQASVKFPWVHTVVSNCKNQLQGTQRAVSLKHLSRYLSEYCYRFNRRFWEQQLFDRLLTACTLTMTVTYSELSQ
jgi:transposase-like protein